MVGGTCGCAERLHLLYEEWHELLGIEQRFCLLVEVGLVGRASALGHEEEIVFVAVDSVEVDLCGKVASGVYLVVHVKRSVLRVAQVASCVCVIYTVGYLLFVASAGVYVLAFLADAYCRTGVLAEGELSFSRDFSVAQHCESHKLIVLAGFWVGKDFGYHLVVLATEHERIVVCCLTGKHAERLGVYHEHLAVAPFLNLHIVGCEVIVLGFVGRHREWRLIYKRFYGHNYTVMVVCLRN
ncbi:hypothetical protein IMSAG192_01684 [Muribaculaceae bacterium]|nr:hypothetical protein IMSAG192_01684 [Muribaculaceae bacterium]